MTASVTRLPVHYSRHPAIVRNESATVIKLPIDPGIYAWRRMKAQLLERVTVFEQMGRDDLFFSDDVRADQR